LDLSLERAGDRLVPAAAAVGLEVPASADRFMRIGEEGVGVRSAGSAAVEGSVSEGRVFYPEVAPDTDFVVAPTRAGAQVMWQLRAATAPERLGVELDLPDGASVRLASPVTDPTGRATLGDAQIVDAEGQVIGSISAPVAIDADGVGVPARFAFDEGQLVVEVPHRAADVRYPVMVDPEVRDVWGDLQFSANCGGAPHNHQPGVWGFGQWVNNFTPICGQEWNGSGNGLYIRSEGALYLDGAVAQWGWAAPAGSYIMSIWFDGLRHAVAGSYLFTGLYGSNAWGSVVHHHQEIAWGQSTQYPDSPYRSWAAFVGLFMQGSYHRPGWGWAGVRGVNIRLGDLGVPEVRLDHLSGGLTYPAGGGLPVSRWVDDAQTPVTVTAIASDWGLGLQDVGVERAGGGWYGGPHHGCQGHRYSPCPRDWTATFNLHQLPEGHNQIHTWSRDIIDQIGIGAPWIQRIDRTPPHIQLTGELIDHATDGQLSANPELYIHATDGDGASLSARRSGVKRIRVLFDGAVVQDNVNPGAECDSCPRGQTWSVPLSQLAGGPFPVRVEATDYLGHVAVREFTINVPWLADGRLLRETGTSGPVFYIDEGVRYALDSSTASYLGVDLASAVPVSAGQIGALPAGDDLTISQLEIGGPEPDPGTATAAGSSWKRARKHLKPFEFYTSDARAVAQGTLLWFSGKFPFGYRHRGDFSYGSFVYPVGAVGCIWLKVKWGYPAASASFPPGGGVSGAETVDGYYVRCRTGTQLAPSPMPMYGLGFAKGLLNSATITICSSDSRAQGPRFCANNKIWWGW